MKNLNKGLVFKTLFLKKLILFGILSALAASCGSDSNKVESDNSTTTFDHIRTSSDVSGKIADVKSQVACEYGGGRLSELIYHTTEYGLSRIFGPFNDGPVPSSGYEDDLYVGVSKMGDIMFVTKITDGRSQVLGYNVRISHCSYSDQRTGVPIVSDSRGRDMEIDYIALDEDAFCGYGSVDKSETYLYIDPWDSDPAREFYVPYFKPNCNGMY